MVRLSNAGLGMGLIVAAMCTTVPARSQQVCLDIPNLPGVCGTEQLAELETSRTSAVAEIEKESGLGVSAEEDAWFSRIVACNIDTDCLTTEYLNHVQTLRMRAGDTVRTGVTPTAPPSPPPPEQREDNPGTPQSGSSEPQNDPTGSAERGLVSIGAVLAGVAGFVIALAVIMSTYRLIRTARSSARWEAAEREAAVFREQAAREDAAWLEAKTVEVASLSDADLRNQLRHLNINGQKPLFDILLAELGKREKAERAKAARRIDELVAVAAAGHALPFRTWIDSQTRQRVYGLGIENLASALVRAWGGQTAIDIVFARGIQHMLKQDIESCAEQLPPTMYQEFMTHILGIANRKKAQAEKEEAERRQRDAEDRARHESESRAHAEHMRAVEKEVQLSDIVRRIDRAQGKIADLRRMGMSADTYEQEVVRLNAMLAARGARP